MRNKSDVKTIENYQALYSTSSVSCTEFNVLVSLSSLFWFMAHNFIVLLHLHYSHHSHIQQQAAVEKVLNLTIGKYSCLSSYQAFGRES